MNTGAIIMGQKMKIDAAAEEMNTSSRTIRRLISDGQLRAYRLGRSTVIRIDRDDLLKLLRPVVPNGKR
jgi:excisionase family DNA binding protein